MSFHANEYVAGYYTNAQAMHRLPQLAAASPLVSTRRLDVSGKQRSLGQLNLYGNQEIAAEFNRYMTFSGLLARAQRIFSFKHPVKFITAEPRKCRDSNELDFSIYYYRGNCGNVKSLNESGILLACNIENFHLAAPAFSDLKYADCVSAKLASA